MSKTENINHANNESSAGKFGDQPTLSPALEQLLKAHQKAFEDDPAIDEVQQLAILIKAAELARQAVPDSPVEFEFAAGYIAGLLTDKRGLDRAKAIAAIL